MLYQDRLVLHGFARAIIRRKARLIARCDGFTEKDLEDIEQELRLFLVQSLDQYDPDQGHINVFITTVVERSAAMLLRERWAKKRNSTGIESLDAGPAGNDTTTDVPDRPGAGGPERFDLALDLDRVLTALPEDLRDLAVRLREQTVSQAARAMNVPRTTLLRQVERLRRCFEDAGLRIISDRCVIFPANGKGLLVDGLIRDAGDRHDPRSVPLHVRAGGAFQTVDRSL